MNKNNSEVDYIINSEVRDCDKSEFEVRQFDLHGKIGDSLGGVV